MYKSGHWDCLWHTGSSDLKFELFTLGGLKYMILTSHKVFRFCRLCVPENKVIVSETKPYMSKWHWLTGSSDLKFGLFTLGGLKYMILTSPKVFRFCFLCVPENKVIVSETKLYMSKWTFSFSVIMHWSINTFMVPCNLWADNYQTTKKLSIILFAHILYDCKLQS